MKTLTSDRYYLVTTAVALILFYVMFLTPSAGAAPAPGMDTAKIVWGVPVQWRDGAPLSVESIYGYEIMHAQIASNSAPCFDQALALPDETSEQSQAIYNCFVSERIGDIEFIKVTNATTIQYSAEYAVGETHAWAVRPIPMDPNNPGEPVHGNSDKENTWGYWSDPVFKTMQFKVGAIETLDLTVENP